MYLMTTGIPSYAIQLFQTVKYMYCFSYLSPCITFIETNHVLFTINFPFSLTYLFISLLVLK